MGWFSPTRVVNRHMMPGVSIVVIWAFLVHLPTTHCQRRCVAVESLRACHLTIKRAQKVIDNHERLGQLWQAWSTREWLQVPWSGNFAPRISVPSKTSTRAPCGKPWKARQPQIQQFDLLSLLPRLAVLLSGTLTHCRSQRQQAELRKLHQPGRSPSPPQQWVPNLPTSSSPSASPIPKS